VSVNYASCKLAKQRRPPKVIVSMDKARGGKPFAGIVPFGKHGPVVGGNASCAILMISFAVLQINWTGYK
jgi:hypothetical protein